MFSTEIQTMVNNEYLAIYNSDKSFSLRLCVRVTCTYTCSKYCSTQHDLCTW